MAKNKNDKTGQKPKEELPVAIGKNGPQPSAGDVIQKGFDDYTQQPQATTAADVNGQDARTRLWQSLDYSYGNQIRKSDEAYDQARSQADRQALSRGMGRSSYNNQTLANIGTKKVEAQNDIRAAQIADYQNRISALEQQEAENERWERQFAEQQKQNEWSRGFQEGEAARNQRNTEWSQNFQQTQADLAQKNTEWGQNFQQQQADIAQKNTEWSQNFQQNQADLAQRNTEWSQNFQQNQADIAQRNTEWSQNFQQNEANRNQQNWEAQFAETQNQNAWNREFQQNEANRSQQNWEAQFAENQNQNAWSREFQENEANRSQQNWETQFAETQRQNEQSQANWEAQFAEQQLQNDISNSQWEKSFGLQQENAAFQREQWQAQVDQWNKQFEYSKMSDEQKINYNYVTYALQNGNDVSDEMLAKAGLSRKDFNAMKQQAAASGASTTGGPGPGNTDNSWQSAGFENANDYNSAKTGGFPDANTYYKAKKLNITNYKAYAEYMATQDAGTTPATTGTTLGDLKNSVAGFVNDVNTVATGIKNNLASLFSINGGNTGKPASNTGSNAGIDAISGAAPTAKDAKKKLSR